MGAAGSMFSLQRSAFEFYWAPPSLRGCALMAAGTLFILDASLPDVFVEGSGDLRYAQTMPFTTLVLFQSFKVFNARSDEQSAADCLLNLWLWLTIILSVALQTASFTYHCYSEPFLTSALA